MSTVKMEVILVIWRQYGPIIWHNYLTIVLAKVVLWQIKKFVQAYIIRTIFLKSTVHSSLLDLFDLLQHYLVGVICNKGVL